MAADSSEELLRVAEDYGRERPGLFLCSCEIREVRSIGDDHYIFLASPEKRCPRILLVRALRDGRHRDVLPYFPVREGPDRQTVSYLIGRDLCNLAEVKELFGHRDEGVGKLRIEGEPAGGWDLESEEGLLAAISAIVEQDKDAYPADDIKDAVGFLGRNSQAVFQRYVFGG